MSPQAPKLGGTNATDKEIDLTFNPNQQDPEGKQSMDKYKGKSKLQYVEESEKKHPEIPHITRKKNQPMVKVVYEGETYTPGEYDPFIKMTKKDPTRLAKGSTIKGKPKKLPLRRSKRLRTM